MNSLPPGKSVFFVSDIHLGVPDRAGSLEREKKLVNWLDSIADRAAAIHLVGDLFDFWFEYRHAVPRGYVRILGKLAELRDNGIPIYAYTGNHDMWMFGYFEEELGIPVYRKPMPWTYAGKDFLVGHGDGIGPGDHGYKLIKKVFNNPLCQWAFARIHPNLGIGLALYWSRRSRVAGEGIDESFQAEAEPQVIYARERLKSEHFNYFIFGHRHCPTLYALQPGSDFVNLGDWVRHFSYALYNGRDLKLEYYRENGSENDESSDSPAEGSAHAASLHSDSDTLKHKSSGSGESAVHLKSLLVLLIALFWSDWSVGLRAGQNTEHYNSWFCAAHTEISNDLKAELLLKVQGNFEDLAIDGLGNLYTLSATGEIRRYSEDGRLLYEFSEVRFGQVGHIDVSNPLRVLVYYPEFLSIVLLSNTLAISSEINLRSLGFNKVRAVGLARDGRIWIYDEANFQLIKIDERGQVIRRSEALNYVLNLELQPEQLSERNDRLFLRDPQHGILVFDAFGTYEYHFGEAGIRQMQIYLEQVVWQSGDGFFFHDLRSYRKGSLIMPDREIRNWSLDGRRLAILGSGSVSVYALP